MNICLFTTQHKAEPVRAEGLENFNFQLTTSMPAIHTRSSLSISYFLLFSLHSWRRVSCQSWSCYLCVHIAQWGFRIAVYISSPSLKQGILLTFSTTFHPYLVYFPSYLCLLLHHPNNLLFLPLNDFYNLYIGPNTITVFPSKALHWPWFLFCSFQSWHTTYF